MQTQWQELIIGGLVELYSVESSNFELLKKSTL